MSAHEEEDDDNERTKREWAGTAVEVGAESAGCLGRLGCEAISCAPVVVLLIVPLAYWWF